MNSNCWSLYSILVSMHNKEAYLYKYPNTHTIDLLRFFGGSVKNSMRTTLFINIVYHTWYSTKTVIQNWKKEVIQKRDTKVL